MSKYSLFSVIGLEIEYMLVDKTSLDVRAQSDVLLRTLAGKQVNQVDLDDIALSNELVMHVIELKNKSPAIPSSNLIASFQHAIETLTPILAQQNLQLLPTGAHPWMDVATETERWPHDSEEIYQQYDKIFNCKGHGWANLQSMHINLPFANDEDFYKLHNAIRILLPLLPALAASTPFLDGKTTGILDSRLVFYNTNQALIPEISGHIIPEFIHDTQEYQKSILEPMYAAIRPFDKEEILQYEWLNSRAAIPKFEYNAIEIRIVDSQECVQADIAIALATHAILKTWINTNDYFLAKPCDLLRLKALYQKAIVEGLTTICDDSELLSQWQLPPRRTTLREVWYQLLERASSELDNSCQRTLEFILHEGNLSERLLKASKNGQPNLRQLYHHLGDCLNRNQLFRPL